MFIALLLCLNFQSIFCNPISDSVQENQKYAANQDIQWRIEEDFPGQSYKEPLNPIIGWFYKNKSSATKPLKKSIVKKNKS